MASIIEYAAYKFEKLPASLVFKMWTLFGDDDTVTPEPELSYDDDDNISCNTQDEPLGRYDDDDNPDYRTEGDLCYFIHENGFGSLASLAKYRNTESFDAEVDKIYRWYRTRDFDCNEEVDYSQSCILLQMIGTLEQLCKPDLSVEEIDRLSKQYYFGMYKHKRLSIILGSHEPEYKERNFYSKIVV
jgi:hypothetical protein